MTGACDVLQVAGKIVGVLDEDMAQEYLLGGSRTRNRKSGNGEWEIGNRKFFNNYY